MPSTLAWLDQDEAARQRMREIVGLFEESGSVDELGLGRVRDAFSDRLFPGTSVLWRRARYLLFVPWTYQRIERDGYKTHTAERAARGLQVKVRDALVATPDQDGVIGARQRDPVAPPDVILWAALESWGIRRPGVGTLAQYRSTLASRPLRTDETDTPGSSTWSAGLPDAPAAFPDAVKFALSRPEAEFLRTLVLADDAPAHTAAGRRTDSMLAALLRSDSIQDADRPWQHPLPESTSDGLREAVRLAGCFSDAMYGASLLYSLLLARARNDPKESTVVDALESWAMHIEERADVLDRWTREQARFWAVVRGINPRVSSSEQRFVERWIEHGLSDPSGVTQSRAAADLVADREAQVKSSRARLTARRDQDRGDGGAVPRPLAYRWPNARQVIKDIRAPLEV